MRFICPKNFKDGKYILSKYRKIDLLILILGSFIGLFLFLSLFTFLSATNSIVGIAISLILSGVIIGTSFLLTLHIPYYHNVLELLITVVHYLQKNKTYIWKGIDYSSEDKGD